MIEMNAVAAGTELDAARDAGREGMSAGWCAWSAGDASLTFSLVVRPDVNMHAFHGLPFVAAMGMMDALVGTASTPGLGLAGKVGIQWPSDIVCGAPAFETSLARVAVNGGAGAAGMFGAVTVDIERSALSELGVDVADEALVETLAAAVLARCPDTPVYTAPRETLQTLTGYALTRGVLCAMRRPAPRTVEDLCQTARRVAVLEGIVDSTNIGAIFRSAAALGMDAVLLSPSCCDPLCRRAVRVSMGTVFQVPWAQIGTCPADWPENGIVQLHGLGFKTAAMALSDRSVSIDDSALSAEPKLAIVLGTEGDGLAHSTIAACDYTVKIPMSHGVDSLNVAAASAVAFWQLGNR
mgnify:CR=1 FL=1